MKPIKRVLPKGTAVCRSILGHYNFQYPAEDCTVLTKDVEVEPLNWIGSQTHYAYRTTSLDANCVLWSILKLR